VKDGFYLLVFSRPEKSIMKYLFTAILFCLQLAVHAQESPGLTATYDTRKNVVKLKWQQTNEHITRYVLQRSSDNYRFIDIYTCQPISDNMASYTDNRAEPGKSYYRLKTFNTDGYSSFGPSIMVIIGKPGNNWLMYPVPVRDVLNLQYNGTAPINGVIMVTIQNVGSGLFFHKLRFASTNRLLQIPVSNLGRGTYDVRLYIGDQIVWNQRFVK